MSTKVVWHIITVFLTVSMLSCQGYKERKFFTHILEKYPNTNKYKVYLFLPREPCGSCISVPYEVVKSFGEQQRKYIRIFFLNNSVEELENRIPSEILYKNNVVINPVLSIEQNDNISYPTILYLDGNKLRKIEKQNAKDPYALERLYRYIHSDNVNEN